MLIRITSLTRPIKTKARHLIKGPGLLQYRGAGLNRRPPGYESDALTT